MKADFFREELISGINRLQIDLNEQQILQLLDYHRLLVKWNRAYNLTAVRDPEQMVSRHLLDSLSILQFLEGQRFIDVGTGGGLPGIVLAIAAPCHTFDLLDSAGKKTRFLFQVKTELGLDNVAVHHSRVEQYQPDETYDGVISRAFASLQDMVQYCRHLLNEQGIFYAMKGRFPSEEVDQLKKLSAGGKSYKVRASHALQVPGETGQRHLLLIESPR